MPFSQTPQGVAAALTCTSCPRLAAGKRLVLVPLPGAGEFECPEPCGGTRCQLLHGVAAPPPGARDVRACLRMQQTLERLAALVRAHEPGERLGKESGAVAGGRAALLGVTLGLN